MAPIVARDTTQLLPMFLNTAALLGTCCARPCFSLSAQTAAAVLHAGDTPSWRQSCCRGESMCGIAGIIYRDPERPGAAVESLVRRMCAAIKHRGPDDEGLYVRRGVGLGMRRLSIIDLSGGRQPIFNEDAAKVIGVTGES